MIHSFVSVGFAFIDPTLLMNMSSDQYGFLGEEEWGDEDNESEWGEDLNKDTTSESGYVDDGDDLTLASLDYDDPLLYQDQSSYYPSLPSIKPSSTPAATVTTTVNMSVSDTLKLGLEDPTIRQEMLRVISKRNGKNITGTLHILSYTHSSSVYYNSRIQCKY